MSKNFYEDQLLGGGRRRMEDYMWGIYTISHQGMSSLVVIVYDVSGMEDKSGLVGCISEVDLGEPYSPSTG
jgi:hypothetical protein